MSITVRERLGAVAAKFVTLEVALFSTFNFNADFFEQNVLPALFGVDPDNTRSTRVQAVHRELVSTRVGVFCDPSQLKPSRKPYRYTVYPVFVKGRLFHPKNIILVGTDEGGTRWVYVASMSANLSLKAWGSNCEGFADTWIHASTEEAGKSVAAFLGWLHDRVGSRAQDDPLQKARVLLTQLLPRRSKHDPEGGAHEDKRSVGLYFSPLHESMWDYVTRRYGAISKVRAASPYWGDVAATAQALRDVPVELIAARVPPRYADVVLGLDVTQLLSAAGCNPKVSTWAADAGRFYHAKLYEIHTKDGKVAGIGSCNFTRRGLFWADNQEATQGNVESMLFDVTRMAWPPTRALSTDQLPETSESDEPQPWPFYVFVGYDWRKGRFYWELQGDACRGDIELLLAEQPPILVNDARRTGQRKAELTSRIFRLQSQGQLMEGVVTELNLGDSTQVYCKPLTTESIIESWRSGAVSEPPPEGDDENGDGDADIPDGSPDNLARPSGPEPASTMFDSFQFFQALKVLRGKLREAGDDRKRLIEWVVSRSDSVGAFVNAICVSEKHPAARLVMCVECDALMRSLPKLREGGAVRKKLRSELARLSDEVTREIAQDLRRRGIRRDARELLDWYVTQIRKRVSPAGINLSRESGA